jgi:PTH2 family peptidyl-tRNA hydrolase
MNGNIKQVIIIRTDLNMRKGKMVAQGAHASMKVFFDRMQPALNTSGSTHWCEFTPEMIKWMNSSFPKIVVSCDSEKELLDLKKQADDAGIINALILDEGRTEFKEICSKCSGSGRYTSKDMMKAVVNCSLCNGTGKINKPTYTCLAIGPDTSEKIDKITGNLKLL